MTPFDEPGAGVSVGKFDSVFGIEYLDNQANFRTGITPSLFARYTTGRRSASRRSTAQQIAPLWSAVSLNVAATNGGNFVEALQPTDASLTGVPVASGRFGYELNLPGVQIKLGASGAARAAQRSVRSRRAAADVRRRRAPHGRGPCAVGRIRHVDEEEGRAASRPARARTCSRPGSARAGSGPRPPTR